MTEMPDDLSAAADWTARFPGLARLSSDIRQLLIAESRIAGIPRGTVIFGPGTVPENLLLLLGGTVRVHQTSDGGREVFLYRVSAGESCVLTTACLLGYDDYLAEGVAETDIEAVLVPKRTFDTLIAQSPEFRRFIFTAYSRRITDLLLVIEEIAFRRIDVRLAQKLIALSGPEDRLSVTHNTLAVELGTAREVISRQLQEFQRRGWVELARGEITLRAPAALERLARS